MKFAAWQKVSLIDFPGRIAALLFTQGCDLHCPYCHNPDLVPAAGAAPQLDAEGEVIPFLKKRVGKLDGVVISGGEPTLHAGLPGFCAELHDLGYAVKLDTNGTSPAVLSRLLGEGLVDYVAMDIKTAPDLYGGFTAIADAAERVAGCVRMLEESGVPHEFRIPCASPFINEDTFPAVCRLVPRGSLMYLQAIRLGRVLMPEFFEERGRPLDTAEIETLCRFAKEHGIDCRVR
ncbi:MAG: anaerobic ribonucleoside-triphosphate reductase activating protein [Mailhella sp.]|nr:anaerobic ribonucleoside-triphosphate reductase activating protein [Mailhella sp.]